MKADPKEELYLQGMDLFSENRLDEAASRLLKALELDAAYGDALHALAMIRYHEGDLTAAIEFGERLRKAEPGNIHAYTSLSMFYNAKGYVAKAEEMGAMAASLAGQEDNDRLEES